MQAECQTMNLDKGVITVCYEAIDRLKATLIGTVGTTGVTQ